MEPIGVTLKHEGVDKYGKEKLGDVMLVHRCTECGAINLNRIAADDPEDLVVKAYEKPLTLPQEILSELEQQDISLLVDKKVLEERLFGKSF